MNGPHSWYTPDTVEITSSAGIAPGHLSACFKCAHWRERMSQDTGVANLYFQFNTF